MQQLHHGAIEKATSVNWSPFFKIVLALTTTLESRLLKHLAMLLLGHALPALLNHGAHVDRLFELRSILLDAQSTVGRRYVRREVIQPQRMIHASKSEQLVQARGTNDQRAQLEALRCALIGTPSFSKPA